MQFHWLRLRATCHPTEDLDKVKQAVLTVSGLPPDVFEGLLEVTHLVTHHGADQYLVEVEMKRNREVRDCLDALLAGDGRAAVAATLEDRVDDDGILYMRADKQRAAEGAQVLGRFDDPVSIRVKNQVHPFTREACLAAWRAWLATA